MTDVKLTQIQRKVLEAIEDIRAEHHACSAGQIAGRLGNISRSYITQICGQLKALGLVDWSKDIPGSLHVLQQTVVPHGPVASEPHRAAPENDGGPKVKPAAQPVSKKASSRG